MLWQNGYNLQASNDKIYIRDIFPYIKAIEELNRSSLCYIFKGRLSDEALITET